MNEDIKYVIIRGTHSGVFAGYLKDRKGQEVKLLNARRIWQWSGANSLSELAMYGTRNPAGCKFPVEIDEIIILDAIEVITCTEKSRLSIKSVPLWDK